MTGEQEAIAFANATPPLLDLLYDLGLMPEQVTRRNRGAMLNIIDHFRWYGAEVRAATVEGCCLAVCEHCRRGLPLEARDGDLLHRLPPDEIQPWPFSRGTHVACEAWAIVAVPPTEGM